MMTTLLGCATTGALFGHYGIPKTMDQVGILVLEVSDGWVPKDPKTAYGTMHKDWVESYQVFRVVRISRRYQVGSRDYQSDILERVAEAVSKRFDQKGVEAEILNYRQNADQSFQTSIDATVESLSRERKLDGVLLIHLSIWPGVTRYTYEGIVAWNAYWTRSGTHESSGVTVKADYFFFDLTSKKKLYNWNEEVRVERQLTMSPEALYEEAVRQLLVLLELRHVI